MRRVKGVAGVGGLAQGRVHWRTAAPLLPQQHSPESGAAGQARFAQAQRQVEDALRAMAESCRREGRSEAAELLDVHVLLVTDEDFVAAVHEGLEEGKDVVRAVAAAGERMAAQLAALADPYLRERAGDVRDVAGRLLAALGGSREAEIPREPFILAADDLPPSACIALRDAPLRGIALRGGSPRGHTAILARGMGIPAVFGLGEGVGADCDGMEALLDGDRGEIVLAPDDAAREAFRVKRDQQRLRAERWAGVRGEKDESPGGQRLDILCSIAAPQDCRAVLENDGRGVGLLRSELFFLTDAKPPEEETQLRAYESVIRQMAGRRVVIRLMDMGADKQAAWLPLPAEENPALGQRGIRLCLAHPEMMRTQLRAICRASARGRVALLLPMVTSLEEVVACREKLRTVQAELTEEGIPFDPDMEMGVMIETPAAVLIAQELAQQADFFSIGANDLEQYLLACDRQSLRTQADARHPAVFRALRMVADAAHGAGKRVGICGEMGARADLIPFFLEIGVDEVTAPPAAVLPLRAALRGVT